MIRDSTGNVSTGSASNGSVSDDSISGGCVSGSKFNTSSSVWDSKLSGDTAFVRYMSDGAVYITGILSVAMYLVVGPTVACNSWSCNACL